MKPIFKVVAGLDLTERVSRKELRKRARPLHKQWLRRVDALIKSGKWSARHDRLADELLNYPSADEGRCYAGQERLGKNIGCGVRGRKGAPPKKGSAGRAARRLLADFCDEGLLVSKRGGPARTASWIFCIERKPLFGRSGPERAESAPERTKMSGLDRTKMSAKPSELEPLEHNPPPKPPSSPPSAERPLAGQLPEQAEPGVDSHILHGELLGPEGEIGFQEFWTAIRQNPGQLGPALARWRTLSRTDRLAISNLIGPDGIDLQNVWAAVWLRERLWEQPRLRSGRDQDWMRAAAKLRAATVTVNLEPHSDEWTAERNRRLAAGESIKLMDTWAAEGRPWGVREGGEP
jgi:hypothetical protein